LLPITSHPCPGSRPLGCKLDSATRLQRVVATDELVRCAWFTGNICSELFDSTHVTDLALYARKLVPGTLPSETPLLRQACGRLTSNTKLLALPSCPEKQGAGKKHQSRQPCLKQTKLAHRLGRRGCDGQFPLTHTHSLTHPQASSSFDLHLVVLEGNGFSSVSFPTLLSRTLRMGGSNIIQWVDERIWPTHE
jgi:hypothetical protein